MIELVLIAQLGEFIVRSVGERKLERLRRQGNRISKERQ